MSDLTFENIKAGDKLMVEGRSFGYSRYGTERFRMKEWVEVFVEKVTPKFYFVCGEKISKSSNKLGYSKILRLPNDGVAPDSANTDEFEVSLDLFRIYEKAPFSVKSLIGNLASLEQAAEFSVKFRSLHDELDAAIAKAKGGEA